MDVLLRELRRGASPGASVEHADTEFSGERMVIGSAADAAIQVLGEGVAPRHATLVQSGAQLQLRCARGLRVRVNGVECETATLNVGDGVEIAGNRLRLIAAPAGFGFAIEVEPDPAIDASQFERAFQTDLEQTWWSKRRLALGASLAVAAFAFAIPLLFAMTRGGPADDGSIEPVGALGRAFGDAWWSTGPLLPAHAHATADRCDYCHRKLFERVRDDACQTCHRDIADHVHADLVAQLGHEATAQRCATCHRDHDESGRGIVPLADAVCTACHADASTRYADLGMSDVRAFDAQHHPAFAPRLAVPASADAQEWKVQKTPLAVATDHSNLKFSHRLHLDADRVVRGSDGAAMQCGDCHRPTVDGRKFEPITMQASCVGCHELSFDPLAPERQLPHGKPREVILALQEYYARRHFDPAAAPVVRERRRLPGRVAEETTCTAGPLPCARQHAAAEIEAQFTRRGCVTCHEVSDTKDADIYERYRVLPVRLSADFFPAARFSHFAHRIQQGRTGDDACLTCHAATGSEESTDLLLPDMPQCLECHRTQPAARQIKSPCVVCHEYHPRSDSHGSMAREADWPVTGAQTGIQP